LKIDND
ncbi:hypothetical protein N499_0108B, partial [Wolbachia pipientis wVitA]